MAIQTQGFQFQNLARYTPVDPTLVGVDFSRIGSGIADAMKLGSSLQQYQMRKQAMEEEQATRESRIAQANAVARLAAARSQEAIKNVELMESTVAKQAEADRERASQILRSGILEFGPRADVERAKGVIALTPETTALTLAQTQAERARLPLETQAKTLGLTRQIGQAQRAIGRGLDELGETLSLQQQIQATALGGLKLGREQAEIINTEADTRLKNAQALAAAAGKARDPLPIVKELNDQIDSLLKRPMVYEDGTVTNLQAYEGRMAARARGEKEGIFRRDIKEDATLNKYLTQLNQLRALSDRYMQSAIGETGGTVFGGTRGGGGAGGGMAVNVPTLGGQAQAGTPYLDNLSATIQRAIGERLGGGVAQVDQGAQVSQVPAISPPVLDDLINASVTTPTEGVVRTPAAAPAAPETRAAAPAATFVIGKDGKITKEKGVVETTKELVKDYGTEAATALALLPGKETKETIKNIASRAALRGEALARLFGPKIAEGAAQATKGLVRSVKPAAAVNLADIYIGKYLGDRGQGMRASEAIGAALATDAQEAIREERIAGILDQIDNVLRSNLSRDEKLARARELQGRINEIRSASSGSNELVRLVPSASGGNALIFPGITSIRPGSDAEELTGPLTESDRVIPELSGPLTESERISPTYGDLLRRFFYGKTLDERINSKFYSGR